MEEEAKLMQKLQNLMLLIYSLIQRYLEDRNMIYVTGYIARKWIYNFRNKCKMYSDIVI